MKLYNKEATRIEKGYRVFRGLNYTKNCFLCGDEFRSRSIKAKYCSQRCKNDIYIKKRREITKKTRDEAKYCIVCKAPIKQTKDKKIVKYCSPKCKQKAYRQRKK